MLKFIKEIPVGRYNDFFFDGNDVIYEINNEIFKQTILTDEKPVALVKPGFYVSRMQLSRDEKDYLIAGETLEAIIWNKETKQAKKLNTDIEVECTCVVEATNGNVLLASRKAGDGVHHFDRQSGDYLGYYSSPLGAVKGLVSDEKTGLIVGLADNYGVVMWNQNGFITKTVVGNTIYRGSGAIFGFEKLNENNYLVTRGQELMKVDLLDWEKMKRLIYFPQPIQALATTPNEDKIFCSSLSDVFLVSLSTTDVVPVHNEPETICKIKISKNGKYLAVKTAAYALRIFEIDHSIYK